MVPGPSTARSARLVVVLAVLAVLIPSVVGCSGGSDDADDSSPKRSPDSTEAGEGDDSGEETGPVGCGDDGRSVEPEIDGGQLDVVNHRLRMIAVGDVLLASERADTGVERRGPDIVRSTDCGATWERLDLPEGPVVPDSGIGDTHSLVGDLAVVTAEIHLDPSPQGDSAYVWTSTDGQDWQGGPVTVPSPDDAQAVGWSASWRLPDGRLIVPLDSTLDAPQQVLQSDDRGASWQVADCPAESAQQLGTGHSCWALMDAGGFWARRFTGEVSLDEGRTWQRPSLMPERPDLNDYPKLAAVVALSGGGWLASFQADVESCPSIMMSGASTCLGDLARSDDGVHWETAVDLTESCHGDEELAEANSFFTAPVPFGDGWLVVYTCADGLEPRWSEAYRLGADGRSPELIAETDQAGASFDQPVAVRDGIVLAQIAPDGGSATLLQLRP
jgi:hypothetical protein